MQGCIESLLGVWDLSDVTLLSLFWNLLSWPLIGTFPSCRHWHFMFRYQRSEHFSAADIPYSTSGVPFSMEVGVIQGHGEESHKE